AWGKARGASATRPWRRSSPGSPNWATAATPTTCGASPPACERAGPSGGIASRWGETSPSEHVPLRRDLAGDGDHGREHIVLDLVHLVCAVVLPDGQIVGAGARVVADAGNIGVLRQGLEHLRVADLAVAHVVDAQRPEVVLHEEVVGVVAVEVAHAGKVPVVAHRSEEVGSRHLVVL